VSGLFLLLLESIRDRFLLPLLESKDVCSGGLKLLSGSSKIPRERLSALHLLNMCFAQFRHVHLCVLSDFPEGYSGMLPCELKLPSCSRNLES
jgi:hypothetical protein